MVKQYSYH